MRFDSGKEPISWFQKEYKEGTIVLRPPFQRKPVWAARQKCYLIESILLGMPVPEIFVHETTTSDGKTVHAIVDGQQRIRAVLQFIGLATPEPDEQEFVGFALDKLDAKQTPQSPFFGKRFVDLTPEERIKLFEYKFHIRYLYTNDESDLRNMFTRLNRYLTALNAQELRHATYVGPFAKLAESLSENEYWLESGLVTRALVRRLGDIDFVSQLLIGVIHGPEGGGAAVVDEYYRTYEDFEVDEGFPDQKRVKKLFESTLELVRELFPDIASLRWGNRTDFYSLFVALADVSREHEIHTERQIRNLRSALTAFAKNVDRRISNEHAAVSSDVAEYARAAERGANDKARRADRHAVLVRLIEKAIEVAPRTKPRTGTKKS